MHDFTLFSAIHPLLARLLGALLLTLGLSGPVFAITPAAAGRPLAEVLNSDGTLKPGANGSFDARQFRMGTAPDGRPVFRPANTVGAGDERWADGFNLPNGASGIVRAVVRSGNDIYIGGDFTAVGNVAANYVAKWNGTAWSSLGTGAANGMNYAVHALAVASNGTVYAGGSFTRAGGVAANHVARWNGTAWSSLGAGISGGNSLVATLAVAGNGDVYAGGDFTQAGGSSAYNIARWNGAWSSLGTGAANGMNDAVNALAVAGNGDVYVGGDFTQAGGIVGTVAATGIAKWSGTAWSSLGTGITNGVGGRVYALALASNGDLYVGGYFSQAGPGWASNVARWSGTTWSSLGTGADEGVNYAVYALALAGNGEVYVGGYFSQAGGTAASQVAHWDGTTWSSLGAGGADGVDSAVYALAVAGNGSVYAGGEFTQAGGAAANRVARWSGTAWSSLGTVFGNGVNGPVAVLAVAGNGDVYVGGSFTQAGGAAANRVARWDGTAWSSLGAGVTNGLNGNVVALAVASNGAVYVGGSFTQAGGTAANRVACWNGTAWSSLGTGFGFGSGVTFPVVALAVAPNGDVYAGGSFTQAGGIAANYIARWNGTTWSSLGTGTTNGMSARVYSLAVSSSGDLYAGGEFMQAGGVAANHVARWNGTTWSSLGTGTGAGTGTANGVDGRVHALAVASNGDVYVGGDLMGAGGILANRVAKWNGTVWRSLGPGPSNGVNNNVYALALSSAGDVYIGGAFTWAGGPTNVTNYVVKWNGTSMSSLGTGLNSMVSGLATGLSGQLYAGGTFTATSDYTKVTAHFAIYDPNAPLATTAATRATPTVLFPNPAHHTATLRLPAGMAPAPLVLTDAQGRAVRRYPAPATGQAALDLRGLPIGLYLLHGAGSAQRLMVE